ncbi:hypothetical protein Salat_1060200 [Sesamum alatum]|uniref:Uncharacterized protein n=1 Tax=Sesamum alatum TaxID=300844 RepID=A0AAE2CSL4_9LAMI|nr:hypothetical protein Salat_1060200 [Sesamum alatum]
MHSYVAKEASHSAWKASASRMMIDMEFIPDERDIELYFLPVTSRGLCFPDMHACEFRLHYGFLMNQAKCSATNKTVRFPTQQWQLNTRPVLVGVTFGLSKEHSRVI